MPSPLDEVVKLFVVTEEEEQPPEVPGVSAFTSRVPHSLLARIDAMAEHAQVSRNEMVNHLLRVGVSQVMAALPDVIRDDIEESFAGHFVDLES